MSPIKPRGNLIHTLMIFRILACTFVLLCTATSAEEKISVLPPNARLAIIGDSITEQRLYSKFIETYLLACAGRKDVDCFQFGWSGEMAVGFAARMETDLSVFEPTLATLCYGMNDGMYSPYNPTIGSNYEAAMRKVVEKLKTIGVKQIVIGSPGAVDSYFFQRFPAAEYNANLAHLGGICRSLATEYHQTFANVHVAMMDAMGPAKKALGEDFQVAGYDGIHPDPNGHLLIAASFLKAMGLNGDIGSIEVDLQGAVTTTSGHTVVSSGIGKVEIESARWPFCFEFDLENPFCTRSILPFCRFNEDLNRLTLKVTHLSSAKAKVKWGWESHVFSREQLQKGINLAAEFEETPFHAAFMGLMEAVAEKQLFEKHAMWEMIYPFRSQHQDVTGEQTKKAFGELKKRVQEERSNYVEASRKMFAPVRHTLIILPIP